MSYYVAGAMVVTTLYSADQQRQAAGDAANAQIKAADRASSVEERMYNQTREDQQPWRAAGEDALAQLRDQDFQKEFNGQDFQTDPGYAFRMAEGQKAIERSASARGNSQSGGTLKALTNYNQNAASAEYENAYNRFNADKDRRFNRLSSLAGLGQTANSQVGQAGAQYAQNVGQNAIGVGNAQAAASIGQANATSNAVGNLGNTWMAYQYMNKKPAGG